MRKLTTLIAVFIFSTTSLIGLSKKSLADLTPPGYTPGYKKTLGGHLSDLFQPRYLIIGSVVLIVVFVVLLKIRKKK
jgi:hypothetical protein